MTKHDNEQLVADLAWEYCEKARHGIRPSMNSYLKQCPNESARLRFRNVVNMGLLLDIVTYVDATEVKTAIHAAQAAK